MSYRISQVAEMTGLSAHTLRFYDKEGLLPFVERSESGVRVFQESDLSTLSTIHCLKQTGMPIRQIKQFMDWCAQGDDTMELRLEFLRQHKQSVLRQMAELEHHMIKIDHKIDYYQNAVEQAAPPCNGDKTA